MNYLAHAYLSFDKPGILVGNMISDFVKGKKQYDYPLPVQLGIRLHRAIDNYTDQHNATREAKRFFKPSVGLYAGAFVDVVYDHFLANDENELPAADLKTFAQSVYTQLQEYKELFPERFAWMFSYMSGQDWLYGYRFNRGIENSFNGLARRAKYLTGAGHAFAAFEEQYAALQQLYEDFFPDVKNFALTELNTLLTSGGLTL